MRTAHTLLFSALLTGVAASPALAEHGHGGDREPAGGAFMSSYLEPGSTGIQRGGPPRSVDIPRPYYREYGPADVTGSIRPIPHHRYDPRW